MNDESVVTLYRGRQDGKRKEIDSESRLVYGNDIIGFYDTRHEAVGAATIRARRNPFPFGEDFEYRSPDEIRHDIRRRMRYIYVYERDGGVLE